MTGTVIRYGASVMAIGAAYLTSHILSFFSPDQVYLFPFIVAIVGVAWYCGTGPGWLAVAIAIFVANYLVIPPLYELDIRTKDIPWLLAFVGATVVANTVSLKRRQLETMLVEARDRLEERVWERTIELQAANERLRVEMSERARAEAALRDAQSELARAARVATVAEFTASIAHEVNQPLTAAVANAQAALNWLNHKPANVGEANQSLVAVVAAAERAASVIARVRSLMVRSTPGFEILDVNGLIRGLVELIRRNFADKEIEIECALEPTLPLIRGDRVQLQQLLLNLINNAVEAMSDVVGRARLLRIQTRRGDPDRITIAIEDSGRGLDSQDAGRLFEPFFSTKSEGMGMGLSLSRTIVEAHGGKIRAIPRSQGAVFEVELPAGTVE